MKFIDRLFPFLSQEIFKENVLTAYWVIALIAIFLIALFYLVFKLLAIRKSIEKNNLQNHSKIGKIWHAYQTSFCKYGEERKTKEFSEEYFNEQNILLATLNLRLINNVSNILIGLGILGTFVGLTYGIADSNFETTEAIKCSINNLLAGMGTAFVTSIWGMGLSLFFTVIFKLWQSNITRRIQDLCLELDHENKIEQEQFEIFQQEKQKKIINDLFNEYLVADTDQGKQLPKNVFRQLLEESVKQTASLQTFSDDLGTSIELAMEKLVADNNLQISQLIEEKLVPVLEDLKTIKQDSGTQVIENAVQRLADSMKLMMDDFKNTITGDTKQEMEGLAARLTVVSESLIGIPNSMADITLQVTEVIEALKETVIKNIEQSKIEAAEINKRNREAFSTATDEYKSTVEDIQDHMELLLSTQKDNIKQVSQINDEIKATLKENSLVNQQFESMIQKSKIVVQLIESISNKFETNSTSLSQISTNLKTSISDFGKSISDYVERNNRLLNYQQETLQKTKDISETYSARFVTIENGLSGIFDQIQTGLKDYQKTTGENLNQYLKLFSSTLTSSVEALESSVSGLTDFTDELNDLVERIANKR
ncbi:MotA/TolQ/ExbB proton channel family protein [Gaoshiqia sediminis]|uniref:MotA/TolQ/ExbB proton channel family protein n=1 Tax=Gaoshiqia sediminis TaxID=2986998 RepID=A0AA41Y8P3_9BACT|nr:MotA/TolQ/ExbB proton channel family protein [Gaoshiqia sediminis]MCW0482983.1 MotA/TolQ/ExbB proton channel family protein [Gaoshiqia sediminis]